MCRTARYFKIQFAVEKRATPRQDLEGPVNRGLPLDCKLKAFLPTAARADDAIVVSVTVARTSWTLDGRSYDSRSALTKALAERAAPTTIVEIVGPGEIPFERAIAVYDAARTAGIEAVELTD